ncbi:peptidoglycan D,D-transpeptidase FtsI family protein [Candidatus Margulisiibacteriota bacterium]
MKSINKYRISFIVIGFLAICFLLIGRLVYLQIFQHQALAKKSQEQLNKIINISPNRGEIFDRNGQKLALTKTAYSAYATPLYIHDKKTFAKEVAPILNRSYQSIYKLINNNLLFTWLARKCDDNTYQHLKHLELEGLHFIKEDKRFYPHHNLFSQVIGFVGVDNQGLGSIEYKYNKYLTGTPGKIILDSDPRGYRIVSGKKEIINSTYDGGHIYTTLDSYIQYISRKHLIAGIKKMEADSGSVIVMDPQTGEILAMVNYPDFNPNNWNNYASFLFKNRCLTDLYEPGSTFKTVTLAAAIEEELVATNTVLFVPEKLKISNRVIKEAHRRKKGESSQKSITDIMRESLNVGTSIIAQKLGEYRFYNYIKNFGFGKRSGIESAGEVSGILRHPKNWAPVDIAMISFGQGIAATPLQMANSVSVIANKGYLLKPKLIRYFTDNNYINLKSIPTKKIRRVIRRQTAEKITKMMVEVVDHGTAYPAKIHGYKIAGKTGTAQIPNLKRGGYLRNKYIASFIGFFPADKPEILILVKIDRPKKSIYGSTAAGPIFKNIAKDIIDYYNIPPVANLIRR